MLTAKEGARIPFAGEESTLIASRFLDGLSVADARTRVIAYLEENGLERCLRKALIDRSRLLAMGEAGRAHVLAYHLNSKILRLMLEQSA